VTGSTCQVSADATDEARAQRAGLAAFDWTGRLDVLVNNAGITSIKPAEAPKSFRRVVDVNLHGLYNSCHHVGHAMIAPPGGSGDEPRAAAIGHGLFSERAMTTTRLSISRIVVHL
jgi:NAD(P)-dependent dehydrogenase (short-subunit alcohol dehydrogenase family)